MSTKYTDDPRLVPDGGQPVAEDENRLALERDLAVRQAKLSKADLQVIRLALNESRPLEALRTTNEAIERLEEELDAAEGGLGDGLQEGDDD